jgi:hypothetical protein
MSLPASIRRPLATISKDCDFVVARKFFGQDIRVKAVSSVIMKIMNDESDSHRTRLSGCANDSGKSMEMCAAALNGP